MPPVATAVKRLVSIKVVDAHSNPLVGANLEFLLNRQPAGGVTSSKGWASIEVPDEDIPIEVRATAGPFTEYARIAPDQDTHTIRFPRIQQPLGPPQLPASEARCWDG